MKRFARWLRLVVTCLAFVIGSPSPATVVDPLDTIVLVANDDASDDVSAEARVSASASRTSIVRTTHEGGAASDSPVLVSRRYLVNCAFLL